MAMTGRIKELRTVDGVVVAAVETLVTGKQSNNTLTVLIGQAAGMECHPIVGDVVYFDRSGAEYVALAMFAEDVTGAQGEAFIFSRSAPETIAATVHLKADGSIEIKPGAGMTASVGNGSDAVAMATKTDAKVDAIANAISGAAVGSADGGTAFKANIMAALTPALEAIGSVASLNLEAD